MVGALAGKRILVTGATGFIGCRLTERLLVEEGAHVRALVRDYGTAIWLSRTTAELVSGDITQPETLRAAVADCDVVFHCAAMLGGDPERMHQVNVVGTQSLLVAAREAEVSRFIHVSSLAVHGQDFSDGADETSPFQPGDDPYAQTKLAAEQLVLDHYQSHRLAVVIVRPTIVYGPRSQWWTIDPIQRIIGNRLAVLGHGNGIANVVYVDDVVTALLLVATAPDIEGEAFIVSGEERITWKEFFGAYANMLEQKLPVWSIPTAVVASTLTGGLDRIITRLQSEYRWVNGIRIWTLVCLRAIRKLSTPLYKLGRWELALYSRKAQVSVTKAKSLLGYCSEWPLSKAMTETEAWLRMQGYLPSCDADATGGVSAP